MRHDAIRHVGFMFVSLLKNKAAAIGTQVSERMNAPNMAKPTVWAIGRNILPSMPTNERIGR
jgi:hypothetical protein